VQDGPHFDPDEHEEKMREMEAAHAANGRQNDLEAGRGLPVP